MVHPTAHHVSHLHGPSEGGSAALGPAFVRVLGTRLDRFVEFEFSLRDADLTVELILPLAAFDEFCAERAATVLPPSADGAAALARLRAGGAGRDAPAEALQARPGLYRQPGSSHDNA